MTREDEFIGQLEAYLDEYEGMTPLPGSTRDAVRAELPTTRQIGPVTGLMRDTYMNSSMDSPARWGLVAAVVVGAVIIGGALIFGGGGVGQPSQTPAPTTSSGPPTPPSEPLPSDAATIGPLDAGTYTAYDYEGSGIDITFTVPDGWQWGDFVLIHGPTSSYVSFWSTDLQVYGDPCQWEGTEPDPPTGGSAIDLVMALAAQPMRDAAIGVQIAVDGPDGPDTLSGFSVELSVPDDIVLADCDRGQFRSWGPEPYERYHQGPGQWDLIWAVDEFVDGDRVVIDAAGTPVALPDMVEEIRAIMDSVVLTPRD